MSGRVSSPVGAVRGGNIELTHSDLVKEWKLFSVPCFLFTMFPRPLDLPLYLGGYPRTDLYILVYFTNPVYFFGLQLT